MENLELYQLLLEAISMLIVLGILLLAIIYYHDFATSNKYHDYMKMRHTKFNERAQMRYDYKYKQSLLKSKGKIK